MSSFQEITRHYKKLCSYCENFWKRTADKYPAEISCSPGCAVCCELQSVNLLEAFAIAEYCGRGRKGLGISSVPPLTGFACPFLSDNRCRIYPARPIICRTHGLLLKSRGFRDRIAPSCLFNFTTVDHAAVDDDYALDADIVTMNLAKLNAAFCLLLGDVKKTEERIALRDLASGKIRKTQIKTAGPSRNRH
jgi:uncharacterized protein